jgi:hypothetical protein
LLPAEVTAHDFPLPDLENKAALRRFQKLAGDRLDVDGRALLRRMHDAGPAAGFKTPS